MKKLCILSFSLLLSLGCFAQKNYVHTDMLSLCYKPLAPVPEIAKMRYSLGFERILNKHFSGRISVNYGQMPEWIIIERGLLSKEVECFTGSGLQLALRYYTSKSTSKRSGAGYGLFVAPYLSYLSLRHSLYTQSNLFSNGNYIEFSHSKGKAYGAGLQAGYKFLIRNKVSVEALLGWASGYSSSFSSSTFTSADSRKLGRQNLVLTEISAGYRF